MPAAERTHLAALVLAALLSACTGARKGSPDNEPTLATLAARPVPAVAEPGLKATPEQAASAYQRFLEAAPQAPQRAAALRRLGDLEMEGADQRSADAGSSPDYQAAITRYQAYLKSYPADPANDRVLYQLARAHELGGQPEVALATLDRLVAAYPQTAHRDEAQFRRGELLFNTAQYAKAEAAYARLVQRPEPTTFHDRALYMHGWAQFKQGRLEPALQSFLAVLDAKIAGRGDAPLDKLPGLSRADRELVEDTLRVASISLVNLGGAESIPALVTSEARRSYEFRIYEQLGELYIRQDRVKDAADTFAAFARRQPLHAQAPVLQARVIGIYERGGFALLALGAKQDYVGHYGVASEFRRANPDGWQATAQPLVKIHLTELARHFHAAAQKSKTSADVQQAVRWYRELLAAFAQDAVAAHTRFLLAELLFEDRQFAQAQLEYEQVAYTYPPHTRNADAAYSALLAQAELEKRAAARDLAALQIAGIASALRFGEAFKTDPRVGAVWTRAAEELFAQPDHAAAAAVAQRVLALDPPAATEQRRVASTVLAHTAFEAGAFDQAEQRYAQVLALTPAGASGRGELVERQAAAIYRQGELARNAGQAREALAQFKRVAEVAPQSSVHAAAAYDAATALIALQDWLGATRALQGFRAAFAGHALQADVTRKLAAIHLEQQQWGPAGSELERMAAAEANPALARDALWQAAELHEKAGARDAAARAYAAYARQHAEPFERQLEARWRLATRFKPAAKGDGKAATLAAEATRELAAMRELRDADLRAGAARTERTRTIGGLAALALTQPALDDYRRVALVEPLARQLKLKKAQMETLLQAYAKASEYAVPEVVTAATFRTAALYQDFGKALLGSQRPKGLNKAALLQYDVMLEEQAFPFEEKATELHEANARRTTAGLYDEWVKQSFAALRELRPVRYGKNERSEGVIDVLR